MFTLSSHNSDGKKKIGKYLRRYSFYTHLPPAMENLASLMSVTRLYFIFKFSVKDATLASYTLFYKQHIYKQNQSKIGKY